MSSAILQAVPWLASMGPDVAEEVSDLAEKQVFAPGEALMVELEVGDCIFLLVEGAANVTVASSSAGRQVIKTLGPGDAVGELSVLTGELRSATVTATTRVEALRLDRPAFDRLLSRHPEIAVHFAREVARGVTATTGALEALLHEDEAVHHQAASGLTGHVVALPVRGSLRQAFHELVSASQQDLPLIALVSFSLTIVVLRTAVWVLALSGASLFGFLRTAYTAGFILLISSTASSLVWFRPSWQRLISATFGAGFALILNELSVFLAFDFFYSDMTTRDTSMVFDVETLYRRSESRWGLSLMGAFLLQLVVLRRFYRRTVFIARVRLRRLFSRR